MNISCFAKICESVGGSIPTFLTEDEFDALSFVEWNSSALSLRIFPLDLLYDNERQLVVNRQTFEVVEKTHWTRVEKKTHFSRTLSYR